MSYLHLLLAVHSEPFECQRLNPVQPHARQSTHCNIALSPCTEFKLPFLLFVVKCFTSELYFRNSSLWKDEIDSLVLDHLNLRPGFAFY